MVCIIMSYKKGKPIPDTRKEIQELAHRLSSSDLAIDPIA